MLRRQDVCVLVLGIKQVQCEKVKEADTPGVKAKPQSCCYLYLFPVLVTLLHLARHSDHLQALCVRCFQPSHSLRLCIPFSLVNSPLLAGGVRSRLCGATPSGCAQSKWANGPAS